MTLAVLLGCSYLRPLDATSACSSIPAPTDPDIASYLLFLVSCFVALDAFKEPWWAALSPTDSNLFLYNKPIVPSLPIYY